MIGLDDLIYISDHRGRVQQFDANGNLLAVWSDPGNGDSPLTGPSTLSVDTDGEIYVAPKDRTTVCVLTP